MNDTCHITGTNGTTYDLTDYRIPALPSDTKKVLNGNGAWASLIDMVYPVGSIYMSTQSTSPATIFGGTWQALANRFLVGAGDTYTAGITGGEAEHTLTEAELPVMHKTMILRRFFTDNFANDYNVHISTGSEGTTNENVSANVSGPRVDTAINNQTAQKVSINIGEGQSHNNLPPYLPVYMWERTA